MSTPVDNTNECLRCSRVFSNATALASHVCRTEAERDADNTSAKVTRAQLDDAILEYVHVSEAYTRGGTAYDFRDKVEAREKVRLILDQLFAERTP